MGTLLTIQNLEIHHQSHVVWIPKNPKKKIANGFKRGIQVFFAAMVLFGDDDEPSLSRSRLRAPDSRDGRQFPGKPELTTDQQRLLAAAGDRRSVVGSEWGIAGRAGNSCDHGSLLLHPDDGFDPDGSECVGSEQRHGGLQRPAELHDNR